MSRDRYLADEFFYEDAGIPRDRMFAVVAAEATAKLGAVVEAALAGNGGQPIRVSVARIHEILADPEFAVMQSVDGDHFVYSIADRSETAQLVAEGQKRRDIRDMGPRGN